MGGQRKACNLRFWRGFWGEKVSLVHISVCLFCSFFSGEEVGYPMGATGGFGIGKSRLESMEGQGSTKLQCPTL